MNKVILIGRLVRDPELRYTQAEEPMAIARYTLAVERRGKRSQDGNESNADFISCVAFGRLGEFAEKYLQKGLMDCGYRPYSNWQLYKSGGTKSTYDGYYC